jgi:hypothetical protein
MYRFAGFPVPHPDATRSLGNVAVVPDGAEKRRWLSRSRSLTLEPFDVPLSTGPLAGVVRTGCQQATIWAESHAPEVVASRAFAKRLWFSVETRDDFPRIDFPNIDTTVVSTLGQESTAGGKRQILGRWPPGPESSHILPRGDIDDPQSTIANHQKPTIRAKGDPSSAVDSAVEVTPPHFAATREFPQTALVVLVTKGEQIAALG